MEQPFELDQSLLALAAALDREDRISRYLRPITTGELVARLIAEMLRESPDEE